MSPHWVDRSLAQSKKDLSLFIICILSWGQCINFQANVVMHNFYNLIFLYSAICNIKIIENALSPHTHPPNTIQRPQVRTEDIKLRFSLRSEVFGACRMGRILFFWFSGIRKASGLRQIDLYTTLYSFTKHKQSQLLQCYLASASVLKQVLFIEFPLFPMA